MVNFAVDSSVNIAIGAIFETGAKNFLLSLARCPLAHQQTGREIMNNANMFQAPFLGISNLDIRRRFPEDYVQTYK